jgi:biotin carboxyl carrier protein
MSVERNGVVERFAMSAAGHDVWVTTAAGTYVWRLAESAATSGAAVGEGVGLAPMPGQILRFTKAVGDSVTAGELVAVVEAMKMEHRITAGIAGKVAKLMVAAGATVGAGDPLFEIAAT